MLDRLIDLVVQFLELFRVFFVVMEYERAVVFRFGRAQRVKGPGLHLCLPFYIERAVVTSVVPTTLDLPAQAVTTADGVQIVASAVVTYRIRDVLTFQTKIQDAEDALADVSRGSIRALLAGQSWPALQASGSAFDEKLTKAARRPALRWGIEVMRVALSDLARVRVFRLLND